MYLDKLWISVTLLAVFGAMGILFATYIARVSGRILNFRSLVIFSYVIVLIFSGLAHASNDSLSDAGFVTLNTDSQAFYFASLMAIAGLIGLCLGCLVNFPSRRMRASRQAGTPFTLGREGVLLLSVGILLIPVTLYATYIMRQYAQSVTGDRIVSVGEGYARYSFLSNWFTWAISFTAIGLLSTRLRKSRLLSSMVVGLAAFVIAGSLAWNGGRSIILLMTFPLIITLLPNLRGMKWVLLPFGGLALLSYIVEVSNRRLGTSEGMDLIGWLDWQWGRFSMLGWSRAQVSEGGLLWGETLWSGIRSVLFGIFGFLGVNGQEPNLYSVTQITGSSILNDVSSTFIVPGVVAELYLNFGFFGIFMGMLLLGQAARWVDIRFFSATSAGQALAFAYIGSLLVFRTVSSDFGALISYMILTGAPVISMGWVCGLLHARRNKSHGRLTPGLMTRSSGAVGGG